MAPLLWPREACGTRASVLDTAGIRAGRPLWLGSRGSAQLRQHPQPRPPGALSACPPPPAVRTSCLQTLPRSLARGTLLPYRPAASGAPGLPSASCRSPQHLQALSPSPPLRPVHPLLLGAGLGGFLPPPGAPSTSHPLSPDPWGGLRITSTRRTSRDCCVRSPPSAFSNSIHVCYTCSRNSHLLDCTHRPLPQESLSWPTPLGGGHLSLRGLQAPGCPVVSAPRVGSFLLLLLLLGLRQPFGAFCVLSGNRPSILMCAQDGHPCTLGFLVLCRGGDWRKDNHSRIFL